ncbi:MAG TPA: hypothetical protein VGY48_12995 [Vicinamibacterales bacterium]|nr:hypothetical protein [Vicinamibacterales bacterium]
MPIDQRARWVAPYALFLTLSGIGYIALQPPFEGFDEFAHYSSLRQIAHTATVPPYGASYLDSEFTNYQGPMPYGSGAPPYRAQLGARSYREFFAAASDRSRYTQKYGAMPPARFQESRIPNWQAQHPPLYYLLVAPVVLATDHTSLLAQTFVLRLASYLLAIGGVWFGLTSIRRLGRATSGRATSGQATSAAALGFILYPVLLPEFFPEFARIGNDSLCLLLLGYLLYVMADEIDPGQRLRAPGLIGLVLGLGLLTKALFLPVAAAVILWLVLCRTTADEGPLRTRLAHMPDIAKVVAIIFVVGGWWYVYKLLVYGNLTGGDEAIRLSRAGGMVLGLRDHFSLRAVVRGLASIPVTWAWTGTWSLARLPAWLELPLVVLALWVVLESLIVIWRGPVKNVENVENVQDVRNLRNLNWLTVLMTVGMGLGLAHRTFQGIAVGGNGNQGGWYLHILMPWVAIAMGGGIWAILRRPVARTMFFCLAAYAAAFHLMAIWSEAALFSGCATKGDDKLFQFPSAAYCFDQASLVFDQLGVLAWPRIALCGFVGAIACGVWMAAALVPLPQTESDTRPG